MRPVAAAAGAGAGGIAARVAGRARAGAPIAPAAGASVGAGADASAAAGPPAPGRSAGHALPDVCRVLPLDERHGAMYVSTLRLTPRILRRLQLGGAGARGGADDEGEGDAELPVSLTFGEGGALLRVGDDTFSCELHRETEADAGKNVPELFLLSDDGLDLIDMGVSHARILVNAGIDGSDATALQKQQLSDARMARQHQGSLVDRDERASRKRTLVTASAPVAAMHSAARARPPTNAAAGSSTSAATAAAAAAAAAAAGGRVSAASLTAARMGIAPQPAAAASSSAALRLGAKRVAPAAAAAAAAAVAPGLSEAQLEARRKAATTLKQCGSVPEAALREADPQDRDWIVRAQELIDDTSAPKDVPSAPTTQSEYLASRAVFDAGYACYSAMNKHLRDNSGLFEQLAGTLDASTGATRTSMADDVRRKIRARKPFVTALEAKFDRVHRVLGELKQQLKLAKALAPS